MSKLTAQDYIDASSPLARVGFDAIKKSLKGVSVAKATKLYDIDEKIVELVKTTGSAVEYQTILRLENERANAEGRVDLLTAEASIPATSKPQPKKWHYVVATLLVVGIIWLITVGLINLIGILGEAL